MFSREFDLTSRWRVEGTLAEVEAVFRDPAELPRWWPEVYLDVRVIAPGDAGGGGRVADIHSRGRLPYTLHWRMTVVEARPGRRVLEASGDLVGRGVWTLVQDGRFVDLTYAWQVRAERPLFRLMAPLLKPLMAWNHRWAMARAKPPSPASSPAGEGILTHVNTSAVVCASFAE